MSFAERLTAAIQGKKTPVLVGLDPRFGLLPDALTKHRDEKNPRDVAAAFEEFCRAVIDVVAPLVPAVKPQAAFFERYGADGMAALARVIQYARSKELVVILDGKRNDIGSTAAAYAAGMLGAESPWGADALTVSPYLGDDSLTPFVETAEKSGAGVFILVKTSNPGGAMIQDLIVEDGRPVYRHIAEYVEKLSAESAGPNRFGAIGAVVGATWPKQLGELRRVMKKAWLLVPGYGSQGGSAADVAEAFNDDGLGALINNSRGILFAHRSAPYAERFGELNWEGAVDAAAREMIDALALATPAGRLRP